MVQWYTKIIDKVTDIKSLDKLLSYELMSMITGDLAKSLYMSTNIKESGVEFWH